MYHGVLLLVAMSLAWGSVHALAQPSATLTFSERHMRNVTRLTFDGDNGEAYFSWDNTRLIWQSNRGGYACDKIWTMNIDGTDKRLVSPPHGAHTCAFFFPSNDRIVFASTSHLPGDCPPKPEQSSDSKTSVYLAAVSL